MKGVRKEAGARRRAGETANGRTGEARIRAEGSMNLRRFLRQGERIGLTRCRRLAHSPPRPFAVSPTRLLAPGFWLLAPRFRRACARLKKPWSSLGLYVSSLPFDERQQHSFETDDRFGAVTAFYSSHIGHCDFADLAASSVRGGTASGGRVLLRSGVVSSHYSWRLHPYCSRNAQSYPLETTL